MAESCLTTCEDYDIEDNEEDITEAVNGLDPDEVDHIESIMMADQTLRRKERDRKKQIKSEFELKIRNIEMKNVDNGIKQCHTCSEKFMLLINPRKICWKCQLGTCSSCLDTYKNERICILCTLNSISLAKTGDWFSEISKLHHRHRRSALNLFYRSLRKLKAIRDSNPPSVRGAGSFRNQNGLIEPYKPLYAARNGSNTSTDSRRKNVIVKEVKAEPIPQVEPNKKRPVEVSVDKPTGKEDLEVRYQDQTDDSRPRPQTLPRTTAPSQQTPQNNSIRRLQNENLHPSNLQSTSSLSHSMTSLYSETEESYKHAISICGEIMFAVSYNDTAHSLTVFIDQCRNIAVADTKKRSTDSYIKTYLLPDKTKSSKRKSPVKRHSVNPTFKHNLVYMMKKDDIVNRVLSVAVWHKKQFGYNLFLGEVLINLAEVDLDFSEPKWYHLQPKSSYANMAGNIYKGELTFELSYKSSNLKHNSGTLYVKIIEAKNLVFTKSHDLYVKGFILPHKKKSKTNRVKGNVNPCWSSLLQFEKIAFEELRDCALELSVMQYRGAMKSREFIGGIRLNLGLGHHSNQRVGWMDAQGDEIDVWNNLMQSNQSGSVPATIRLRPNLDYF